MYFKNVQPQSPSQLNRLIGNILVVLCIWLVTHLISGCSPKPAVHAPASELEAVVLINDTSARSFDAKVPVHIRFYQDGQPIILSDATITCNGVILADFGKGYQGRVPVVPQGGTYVFRHMQEGLASTVTLQSPIQPANPTAINTSNQVDDFLQVLTDQHTGSEGFKKVHSRYAFTRYKEDRPSNADTKTLKLQASL